MTSEIATIDAQELFDWAKAAIENQNRIQNQLDENQAGMPKSPSFEPYVKGGTAKSPMDAVDAKIDRENQLAQGVLRRCNLIIDCAWDLLDEIAKRQSYECEQVIQKRWIEDKTWEITALEMGYKTRDRACRKAQAAFGWADLHYKITLGKSDEPQLVRID